jgi:hypothetical protein
VPALVRPLVPKVQKSLWATRLPSTRHTRESAR